MSYFHEEQRFGWWILAILAIILLPIPVGLLFVALLYPGPIVFLVIVILVLLLLLLLFWLAKLVVDVDESGVHASFHFLWPTRHIRFEDIKRATATRYNSLLDYGGWGVRLTPKGWAFNTGGSEGVLIETVKGKRIMIGSHRAMELKEAIARASAARTSR